MIKENYYAKILLFGEYGIILDSMALTVPFTHFHGELSFGGRFSKYKYTDYDFAQNSNTLISDYADHLQQLQDSGRLNVRIDLGSLKKDLEQGLYFESSIPQGYGLGSSGALVAAIYDRYVRDKIIPEKNMGEDLILELKKLFSLMESYFHGRSSGIDPLNAYIKYPLLFRSSISVRMVEIPQKKFRSGTAIFLISSGEPGKTEPLVNLFLRNTSKKEFNQLITERFIPLNNLCIENLILAEMGQFFMHLRELSEFQIRNFNEMIPAHVRPVWEHGLEDDSFTVKLCGSGGGGYFLGFTRNFPVVRQYLKAKNIDYVTVYKGP